MLIWAHKAVMGMYLFLPPVAAILTLALNWRNSAGWWRAWRRICLAVFTAAALGVSTAIIYSVAMGGMVVPSEAGLICYWALGLICILKLMDVGFDWLTRFLFAAGHENHRAGDREVLAQAVRVALLFLIGLPYMMVAAATLRPEIPVQEKRWDDLGGSAVVMDSMDGVKLAAKWLAADPPPRRRRPGTRPDAWGHQTAIITAGSIDRLIASSPLIKELQGSGYNVLAVNLRGDGHSGGQIVSFGANERLDVLGAVRWLNANQPDGARRIVAIGIDTGGAAVLGAAADSSPQGRAIAAVVVYGTFNTLEDWAQSRLDDWAGLRGLDFLLPPLKWGMKFIGLPLASLQTGADLMRFSPANDAAALAPRPLLVVQAHRDSIVPFWLGQNLYQSASVPKSFIWTDESGENTLGSASIVQQVRQFLDTAHSMV